MNQESVGSIPTPGTKQQLRDRLTVGRDALNVLMLVRFQLPQLRGPVVQRQRLLSYKQETMVQLHPGLLTNAQVRQPAERLSLNPRDCRFDSCSGHIRLGRQLADHLGLEPGMLWVRIPPELLKYFLSSWSSLECSPACHAGDRGFKSHRGRSTARYANWKSGEAQTFVTL